MVAEFREIVAIAVNEQGSKVRGLRKPNAIEFKGKLVSEPESMVLTSSESSMIGRVWLEREKLFDGSNHD
jgi:hypothetical protein